MSELDSWLESTAEKRAELLRYSLSPIPTDPGVRQVDIGKALTLGQDAGDLLADIEKHLTDETGRAVLDVRKKYDDLTAEERRAQVKASVSSLARLRDGLQVICTSIKDRRFTLMSVGRW